MDYRRYCIDHLIQKEKEGHPRCTYLLGIRYLEGKEVELNYDLAFKYLSKAAELCENDSYYDLGMCYKLGEGTCINMIKYYFFIEKAEQISRDRRAYYELGLIYKKSILNKNQTIYISKDYKKAFIYFSLAYQKNKRFNNIPEILHELGLCYKNGFGVEKNEKKAFNLFEKAISMNKVIRTQIELALCYKDGIGIEKNEKKSNMMFKDILKIIKCKCKCDNKQIVINNLISYYENKKQNENDLSIKKIYNLANYYYIDENYGKAFEYYEETAYNKYAPSQYGLFICYYKGLGVEKNIKIAIDWLILSAKEGNKQSILMANRLNVIY
jgi:TPR repeat protein